MRNLDAGQDWHQQMKVEDGKLYIKTTQDDVPTLEANRRLKLEGGARMMGWGRMEASIPMVDWVNLKRKYPDLSANDPQIRKKEWERVLRMPENKKFMTVDSRIASV